MTTNFQAVINGLTKEFQENSDILAFVLVGSQVRETIYKATEQSDIDLYVIVRDEAAVDVESSLPDLVSRFGNILFSFKHQIGFVAVYEDLVRLEIPVVKESQLDSVFSRPKAQETKVLFDRTNGKLEEVLSKRPDTLDFAKLFTQGVTNFWYWQILAVQYFNKGEFYNARKVLSIHESALIKLFELLNDPTILLLETNKRIEEFLIEEQQDQLKLISPSYNPAQIKAALRIVVDIIPKVAKEVSAKYNYAYDQALEDNLKPRLSDQLNK
jgi:predicted nucleotidyltransferase